MPYFKEKYALPKTIGFETTYTGKEKYMAYDGFTSYEGDAKLFEVFHDRGTTFVHATSEIIALQRFTQKYPERSVRKIERR